MTPELQQIIAFLLQTCEQQRQRIKELEAKLDLEVTPKPSIATVQAVSKTKQ